MTQRFEGVIGRDWRDSTPWWPPEPAARRRAERAADRARRRRLRAARLLRLRHRHAEHRPARGRRRAPHELPHHRARARPPVRACSPAATITATAWAASPTSRPATPATGAMIPRENGFLPEILRENGYATYAVGKWHLTPDDEMNMAGVARGWPLGRGFDRWYGFHGGETHQFVPSLYHDNHSVLAARRRSRAATTSAPTSRIARSSSSPTCAPSTPTSRSSATSRPVRATRRTTRRRNGSRSYTASSTRDGTCGATRRPRARSRAASCPQARAVGAAAVGSRMGRPRSPRIRPWPRASWSASPRYLSYTDAQIGRVLAYLEETGDLDNTLVILCSDNGASSEGGIASR